MFSYCEATPTNKHGKQEQFHSETELVFSLTLLELQLEGAMVSELATVQGVSPQRLRVQLEAAREALRSVMPTHIAAEQEMAYAAA